MIVPSAEQIRQIRARADNAALDWRLQSDEPCDLIDDLRTVLTLLDTLSQELERLKQENTALLTRSGKPDADRDFSIHAATGGGQL